MTEDAVVHAAVGWDRDAFGALAPAGSLDGPPATPIFRQIGRAEDAVQDAAFRAC